MPNHASRFANDDPREDSQNKSPGSFLAVVPKEESRKGSGGPRRPANDDRHETVIWNSFYATVALITVFVARYVIWNFNDLHEEIEHLSEKIERAKIGPSEVFAADGPKIGFIQFIDNTDHKIGFLVSGIGIVMANYDPHAFPDMRLGDFVEAKTLNAADEFPEVINRSRSDAPRAPNADRFYVRLAQNRK